MFQRVIVPLDGSELSEQALQPGVEMAKRYDCPLVLLRAYDGPDRVARTLALSQASAGAAPVVMDAGAVQSMTDAAEAGEEDIDAYLNGQASKIADSGVKVMTLAVDASPADAIVHETEREPGALLVMTTHGRSGVSRLLFGSVAQDVMHRAKVPVTVIRPGQSV